MTCSCGGECRSWAYETLTAVVDVWHCDACGRELRKFSPLPAEQERERELSE